MGLHLAGDEIGFYSGVIVNAVTPNYYEGKTEAFHYVFEVDGQWLTNLPDDAKGHFSTSNRRPTEGIQRGWNIELTEKSFNHVRFEHDSHFAVNIYLGCITNADNSVIYWVNDSEPLP